MSQHPLTQHIVNLKIGLHKLNQTHLVNMVYPRLL
jgi:hypothetical protein